MPSVRFRQCAPSEPSGPRLRAGIIAALLQATLLAAGVPTATSDPVPRVAGAGQEGSLGAYVEFNGGSLRLGGIITGGAAAHAGDPEWVGTDQDTTGPSGGAGMWACAELVGTQISCSEGLLVVVDPSLSVGRIVGSIEFDAGTLTADVLFVGLGPGDVDTFPAAGDAAGAATVSVSRVALTLGSVSSPWGSFSGGDQGRLSFTPVTADASLDLLAQGGNCCEAENLRYDPWWDPIKNGQKDAKEEGPKFSGKSKHESMRTTLQVELIVGIKFHCPSTDATTCSVPFSIEYLDTAGGFVSPPDPRNRKGWLEWQGDGWHEDHDDDYCDGKDYKGSFAIKFTISWPGVGDHSGTFRGKVAGATFQFDFETVGAGSVTNGHIST